MTGRVRIRQIIVLSAAACLLLISSRAFAQSPPAGSESEQRLKALEAKMDKVLKLLEPRGPVLSPLDVSEKHRALVQEARDTLLVKFEAAQQAYQDFRTRTPIISRNGASANLITQRSAKNEAALQELQQREAEVAARTALVKNVGDNENQARALLILLQRRGVDVELLRRTGTPPRDEAQTAVALVHLYGESLRQEADEFQQLVHAAEERIEKDRKTMREMNNYEVTEEMLRSTRDQTQKMLDVIVAQLSKMDVLRQQQAPK